LQFRNKPGFCRQGPHRIWAIGWHTWPGRPKRHIAQRACCWHHCLPLSSPQASFKPSHIRPAVSSWSD